MKYQALSEKEKFYFFYKVVSIQSNYTQTQTVYDRL